MQLIDKSVILYLKSEYFRIDKVSLCAISHGRLVEPEDLEGNSSFFLEERELTITEEMIL